MGRPGDDAGGRRLRRRFRHLVLAAGFFKVGEKAPSFALTAITGETVGLDAYKGKVVVLGLFHICDPCMMQGTTLQKVSEMTKGKDVVVLGVNSSGNSKKEIGEFLDLSVPKRQGRGLSKKACTVWRWRENFN